MLSNQMLISSVRSFGQGSRAINCFDWFPTSSIIMMKNAELGELYIILRAYVLDEKIAIRTTDPSKMKKMMQTECNDNVVRTYSPFRSPKVHVQPEERDTNMFPGNLDPKWSPVNGTLTFVEDTTSNVPCLEMANTMRNCGKLTIQEFSSGSQ